MTYKFAPVRWRTLFGVAIGVGVLTFIQTRGILGWAPVRWTTVSAMARESLFLNGPFVAAVGATVARVNTTVATSLSPGRSWRSIAHYHLRTLGLAVASGFALGLVPAFGTAATRATAGAPSLLVILSGFAGLGVMLVVGYLIGAFLGAPTGVIVAAVLGFAATGGLMILSDIITSSGMSLSLFSIIPFWGFPLSRGSYETWQVAGFRLILFTALIVAITLLVPRLLDLRLAARRPKSFVVARTTGPAAGLALLALIVQPAVTTSDPNPPTTCRKLESGALCVYKEEDAIANDAARAISEVVARFGLGALNGRFTSIRPEQLSEPLRPGDFVFTPQVHYDRAWLREAIRFDTARGISGAGECDRLLPAKYGADYYNSAPRSVREADVLAQLLANELARRSGVQADDVIMLPRDEGTDDWPATTSLRQKLMRLSDSQLRAGLLKYGDDLRTCSLRFDQLAKWPA